jgi:di/tripeptidase
MANMSCGYYNPHLDNEFVIIEDVMNTLNLALELIENIAESYDYE